MSATKPVARNKKAFRDYKIEERFEAGIALHGSEVKSLRAGQATLTEAYVEEVEGELFLVQCHISPYKFANINNHDPDRNRKLLMHRREIDKLSRRINERGYTAVALSLYFKNGRVKLELGLAHGKRQVDKRHDIRARDKARNTDREWKERSRG